MKRAIGVTGLTVGIAAVLCLGIAACVDFSAALARCEADGGNCFGPDAGNTGCALICQGECCAAEAQCGATGCCQPDAGDAPDDSFLDTNCDGIDGTVADAIFVDPQNGVDDGGDGSQVKPKRHLNGVAGAIASAVALGRHQILIARGVLSEANPVAVPSGFAIAGGYDPDSGWQRDGGGPRTTLIVTGGFEGVLIANLTGPTLWDRVDVVGPSTSVKSASVYGLMVIDAGTWLRVTGSTIAAGDAGSGANSSGQPSRPTAAANGAPGTADSTIDCCNVAPPTGNCSPSAGGQSAACGSSGGDGGCALIAPSSGEGLGGGAASDAGGGTYAASGAPGTDGHSGDGGTAFGACGPLGCAAANGEPGADGAPGGGGGGGEAGADAADDCFATCFEDCIGGSCYGAPIHSGAGGGAGGCGGTGSSAATGGGGSIGLYIWSSSPDLSHLTLASSMGGQGGNGSPGGYGAVGGLGNPAIDTGFMILTATASGAGGDGGSGGSSGGGGGGPSVPLAYGGGSSPNLDSLLYRPGIAGAGGDGGTLGFNTGATGFTGDTFIAP